MSKIRTLFSRDHTTVFPKLGVFLAGPTPPDGNMKNSWRRRVMEKLKADQRLNPSMVVVAPEPQSGNWSDIEAQSPSVELNKILDKQIPWEWQYLNLCDITAFWLPTYWNVETSGIFPANIGPTSRWEFGFFFQEYLKNTQKRKFIIGSPEDAESIKWAKRITDMYGIKWHTLKIEEKDKLVADSFVNEISETLQTNSWGY